MKESIFVSEFRLSLKTTYPNIHCYKIPDFPVSYTTGNSRIRYSIEKPYDMYAVYKGIFYAFEFKLMKTLSPFKFENVYDHQIKNLMSAYENGGKGFLCINYRCGNGESPRLRKILNLDDKAIMVTFVFAAKSLLHIFRESGKECLTYTECFDFADAIIIRQTTENKERIWDVSFLLNF